MTMRGILFQSALSVALFVLSTSAQDACFGNLSILNSREGEVNDTSVARTYTLCADTIFTTGVIEDSFLVGGQTPLNLRPNVTIKCGDSGSRSNNCTITGGIGLLGSPGNFGDSVLEGVEIMGITFLELSSVTFFIGGFNGDIRVTDCAFLGSSNTQNIYLEAAAAASPEATRRLGESHETTEYMKRFQSDLERYQLQSLTRASRALQTSSAIDTLNTTFTGCLFQGNDNANPTSTNFTMVYLVSVNQHTVFRDSIFNTNDFGTLPSNNVTQAIVFSNGGSLEFDTTCFIDNRIRGFGQVVKLGDLPTVVNTAGNEDPNNGLCSFVAAFEGALPGGSLGVPTCIEFDSTECTATGSIQITPMPTEPIPPSPAPTPACVDDLTIMGQQELDITDLSVRRTYILCPSTTFETGEIVDGRVVEGQNPILLRANMTVQCGFDGSRSNDCIITGKNGLVSSPNNYLDEPDIGLAIVEGISFVGLEDLTMQVALYDGVVLFKDCLFKDSMAKPNIYLEGGPISRRWLRTQELSPVDRRVVNIRKHNTNDNHAARRLQSSVPLDVTFEGCTFEGNSMSTASAPEFGLDTLVFIATSEQVTTFEQNVFESNDYASQLINPVTQTLIYNNGGSLEMDTNCFFNNRILGAEVISLGENAPISSSNYGDNSVSFNCDFMAYFAVLPGSPLLNPTCVVYEESECVIPNVATPTSPAPSGSPSTPLPTFFPSSEPSSAPVTTAPATEPPSDSPSMFPSQLPSERPSQIPSTTPSRVPSKTPSLSPSEAPAISPTPGPTPTPKGKTTNPSALPTTTQTPSLSPSLFLSMHPSSSPTALPTSSPTVTARPSTQPTSFPSTGPSVTPSPTISPSTSLAPSVPTPTTAPAPPATCAERGEECVFSSDCCGGGCRFTGMPFVRRCSAAGGGSRGNKNAFKLGAGQGGAGGAAAQGSTGKRL